MGRFWGRLPGKKRWTLRRSLGFTILELLIAAGAALLILLLVIALFLGGKKLLYFGTEGLEFRQVSFALQAVASDLENNAKRLYYPDKEDLFQDYGTTTLVFGNPSGQIVGYAYDANRQELFRVLYDPHFNPGDPSTLTISSSPGSIRVLAQNLDYVEFQADPDLLLNLLVLPKGAGRPLETKVNVPWFQVAGAP